MPDATKQLKKTAALGEIIRKRVTAILLDAACFAGLGLLIWHSTRSGWKVPATELGGIGRFEPLRPGLAAQLRADTAGPWLPVLGSVLLAAGGLAGWVVSAGLLARRLCLAASVTLAVLAVDYGAENWLLADAVRASPSGASLPADVMFLQGTAFLRYGLLPIAAFVALLGALTSLSRLTVWLNEEPGRDRHDPGPAPAADGDNAHWTESSAMPRSGRPAHEAGSHRTEGERQDRRGLGICLSGGGIRSATFALGALQALQGHRPLGPGRGSSELTRAEYLSAVSGGSYTAGAFLLATRPRTPEGGGDRQASLGYDHVFRPGSPEFDHLRRHSSYIADGVKQWAIAFLVVIRGALVSMFLLGLFALTAGRWAGYFYHEFGRVPDLRSPWHPIWGPALATFSVIALSVVLWALSTCLLVPARLRRGTAVAAQMTACAATVLVTLGAVIPIVTHVSITVINSTGGAAGHGSGTASGAAKGGVLAAIGAVITVLGLLGRNRSEVLKAAQTQAVTWQRRLGDLGGRIVQGLAVYAGLALVAVVYLIIFGYSTFVTAKANPAAKPALRWGSPPWTLPLTSFWLTVGLTGLLVVIYLLVDETSIGLHPFYRRRLAGAFAVHRTRAASPAHHRSGYEAVPYEWQEQTMLADYGYVHGKGTQPQVIFCAAAHCSDPDTTPPGRHVLPFAFSHDWVGGPELGWCPTSELERLGRRLRNDMTVQTAMAVSGAAFASETGAYHRPANVILALTNARLGTWIAHPRRVAEAQELKWWQARPPKIRRLSYLLREIFGWYPKESPLVFVTDGGHYENLGLLELLRRRCTEIYCFDASSDAETFAAALARSITLAYDELGVTIRPHDPEKADPRTGGEDFEAGDLKGRLAKTPIITASIAYPPEDGADPVPGVLVIGRATLDKGTPWEIRRHAAAHSLFPNDATGDQWFDDCKFNAYTGLGRYVGQRAIDAMRAARSEPISGRQAWGLALAYGEWPEPANSVAPGRRRHKDFIPPGWRTS